ncbi:hypothetical protein [Halarchaeum acidiphilum]|nr:hypothetical protein [Halarchaeum acidiphilum]
MSPSFHNQGGNPPVTEGALLSKIETALDGALDDLDLDGSQSSVKREKYLWLAVEEFSEEGDEPITYSWFKWGVSSLAGPGGESTSRTLSTDFSIAANLFQATHSQIKDFFVQGNHQMPLKEWWDAEFLEFLEEFYTHYAPEDYRQLYLTNIRLLKIIDDIEEALNFRRSPARRATYEDITDATKTLKKQVLRSDALEDNYEYVNDFAQLLEDVVMMLVDIEGEDIEQGHQTAISELEDFYRDEVWLMTAHSISIDTAEGPNKGDIYEWSSQNRDRLKASFEESLKKKKEICDAVGLLPGIQDYTGFETGDKNLDETVDEFLKVAGGRSSHE